METNGKELLLGYLHRLQELQIGCVAHPGVRLEISMLNEGGDVTIFAYTAKGDNESWDETYKREMFYEPFDAKEADELQVRLERFINYTRTLFYEN